MIQLRKSNLILLPNTIAPEVLSTSGVPCYLVGNVIRQADIGVRNPVAMSRFVRDYIWSWLTNALHDRGANWRYPR